MPSASTCSMIDRTNYPVNYRAYFADALDRLHSERRYRVFADIERMAGRFPHAIWHAPADRRRRDLVLQRLSRHGPAPRRD